MTSNETSQYRRLEKRRRLDVAVVERGLVGSRSRAHDLIARGHVAIDGAVCRKPAQPVADDSVIAIVEGAGADGVQAASGAQYVSRGALKLVAALDHFCVDPSGHVALDIGASTGGFTQVLLERGAAHVTAVDVGTSQLSPILRADRRVTVLEQTDARRLDRTLIPRAPAIMTADVSFISLTLALGPALALAAAGAHLVALVKPQFEAGRAAVGRGGIVHKAEDRAAALASVRDWLDRQPGWRVLGTRPSPITGRHGNEEHLLAAIRDTDIKDIGPP